MITLTDTEKRNRVKKYLVGKQDFFGVRICWGTVLLQAITVSMFKNIWIGNEWFGAIDLSGNAIASIASIKDCSKVSS